MTNFLENSESQNRQYIDAETVYRELLRVQKAAQQTRGGMIWREMGGKKYLIRTSTKGAQKSLGPETEETVKIFDSFSSRKADVAERLASLRQTYDEQKRLNRALRVGRVPTLVVDVLNAIEAAGLSEHFTVVGTHSLYAYESACGVRFMPQAMATRDIDLLLDTRKHLAFVSKMKEAQASFLGILKKADRTFERVEDRKETVINSTGFEIDVIRRVAKDGDPHPFRLSDDEDDVWAVQAPTGDRLLGAARFSQMVVATSGEMAMMTAVDPVSFAHIKRQLAAFPDRDPRKAGKDLLQAQLVEELVATYMPSLSSKDSRKLTEDEQSHEHPAPG